MESKPGISFDDTEIAFSYKSTGQLKMANFIFSMVNHPLMSALSTGSLKLGLALRLPIKGIIKKTAFEHFCGGETIAESEPVIQKLGDLNVGTILDYSVEGEKSEAGFDATLNELLLTIDRAKASSHMPFSVFKITGIGSADLLEKVQQGESLSDEEKIAFERFRARVDKICSKAYQLKVPVLIDAEETWIQDPIDDLVDEMMAKYNREQVIVLNTYQLYRTDSYGNLTRAFDKAKRENYHLGAKLVRGAYMEKERERARQMGYPSPIHQDKPACDKSFNDALLFCINNIDRIMVMCGSHNEFSNLYGTRLMNERGISPSDKRVWFGQLYGMSDNISFNLARAGYNVAKYVPYGPVRSVMPYLLRRAAENTSVAGQSSRELLLIRKELSRRESLKK
jgi:proline dehydrogenase